ncbi:MAG TPA: hypothetical protein VJK53_06080 [Candidatus Paceibacterota bacterium]
MKRVFSRISYVFLAFAIGALVYCLMVWIPLWSLLSTILFNSDVPISANASASLQLLYSSLFDLAAQDAIYAITLAVLIGINTALLVFYFKLHRIIPSKVNLASGLLGAFAAILGFGCAACGSLFATALLASIAGTGLAAAIPLDAYVFQIVGIALLLFSIFQLSRAINKPLVCPI